MRSRHGSISSIHVDDVTPECEPATLLAEADPRVQRMTDPDEILYGLLAEAIDECAAWARRESPALAEQRDLASR